MIGRLVAKITTHTYLKIPATRIFGDVSCVSFALSDYVSVSSATLVFTFCCIIYAFKLHVIVYEAHVIVLLVSLIMTWRFVYNARSVCAHLKANILNVNFCLL